MFLKSELEKMKADKSIKQSEKFKIISKKWKVDASNPNREK